MDAILSFLDRLKQAFSVRRRVKAAEDQAVGEVLAAQAAENDAAMAKAQAEFESQKRDPAAPVAPMTSTITLPLPGPRTGA